LKEQDNTQRKDAKDRKAREGLNTALKLTCIRAGIRDLYLAEYGVRGNGFSHIAVVKILRRKT